MTYNLELKIVISPFSSWFWACLNKNNEASSSCRHDTMYRRSQISHVSNFVVKLHVIGKYGTWSVSLCTIRVKYHSGAYDRCYYVISVCWVHYCRHCLSVLYTCRPWLYERTTTSRSFISATVIVQYILYRYVCVYLCMSRMFVRRLHSPPSFVELLWIYATARVNHEYVM